MRLRDVDFGWNVTMMSGARGFEGEGYKHHWITMLLGMIFWWWMVFFAKTVTANRNHGFMKTSGGDCFTPEHILPDCIVCGPRQIWHAVALNAVGLTNVGIEAQLERGAWQKRKRNFFISFMPIAKTLPEKLIESRKFVSAIKRRKEEFRAKFGVEVNFSCPNVGAGKKSPEEFIRECHAILDALAELGVPILAKFSVTTEPQTAKTVADHRACDGITITNTIPFGELPDRIDWEKYFGSATVSPLERIHESKPKGGLSGAPLVLLACEWITAIRKLGFAKHINGGGGVMYPWDPIRFKRAGADSVAIGIGATLRPMYLLLTIPIAHLVFMFTRKESSCVS